MLRWAVAVGLAVVAGTAVFGPLKGQRVQAQSPETAAPLPSSGRTRLRHAPEDENHSRLLGSKDTNPGCSNDSGALKPP